MMKRITQETLLKFIIFSFAMVITFTVVVAIEESEINLLTIYDKAERESISPKEIEALLKEADLL